MIAGHLDALPPAERGVWHRQLGDVARSLVTGEPVATLCGARLHPLIVEGIGRGAAERMPRCVRCEAMLGAWAERWGERVVDDLSPIAHGEAGR